jgi:hypothetical protein
MDPMFVQMVIARVTTAVLSPQLLQIIETYFEMDAMSPAELESIAPVLKTLYDWIEAVCRVAILNAKLAILKKELDEKQRELNDYVEEMNLEKASIEQVEVSLGTERQALDASMAACEEMQKEFQEVEARKKSIDSIFKGIDYFTEKWTFDASRFLAKREAVVADSILFSFYLIFCGSMSAVDRQSALNELHACLSQIGLEPSNPDIFEVIADKFTAARIDSIEGHQGPVVSVPATIGASHVLSTPRTSP